MAKPTNAERIEGLEESSVEIKNMLHALTLSMQGAQMAQGQVDPNGTPTPQHLQPQTVAGDFSNFTPIQNPDGTITMVPNANHPATQTPPQPDGALTGPYVAPADQRNPLPPGTNPGQPFNADAGHPHMLANPAFASQHQNAVLGAKAAAESALAAFIPQMRDMRNVRSAISHVNQSLTNAKAYVVGDSSHYDNTAKKYTTDPVVRITRLTIDLTTGRVSYMKGSNSFEIPPEAAVQLGIRK